MTNGICIYYFFMKFLSLFKSKQEQKILTQEDMLHAEELLFEAAGNVKDEYEIEDEEIRRLIKFGVDVNAVSHDNFTPLMDAARVGNLPGVKTLIKYGADVNYRAKTNYGLSTNALLEAVNQGNIAIAQVLIDANARVNTVDHNQQSVLSRACRLTKESHPSIIKLLLSNGAEVNTQDRWGMTPLMRIIQAENSTLALMMMLLDSGADWNLRDINHHTAIKHAIMNEKFEMISVLNAVEAKAKEEEHILLSRRFGLDENFWNYEQIDAEEKLMHDAIM